jgi:tRNA threonylcarbamoyladenosine biosynthesis protein TsaB
VTLIGFDTSLATTSACVLRDDGESFHTPAPAEDRLLGPARHSQELLPEVERLLEESHTTWDDVESIAIGIGPGTFTGLRIGISTARALGQALRVDLRPVSSLEVIAAAAAEATSDQRPLLSLIDARRRQVFVALYEPPHSAGSRPIPIWKPEVVNPESLVSRVHELDPSPVCAGDWAIKSRSSLEGTGGYVPPSESGLHAVSGLHLCRLALSVEAVSPADVYPVYLRLPDAEINRARGLGINQDDLDDSQDR